MPSRPATRGPVVDERAHTNAPLSRIRSGWATSRALGRASATRRSTPHLESLTTSSRRSRRPRARDDSRRGPRPPRGEAYDSPQEPYSGSRGESVHAGTGRRASVTISPRAPDGAPRARAPRDGRARGRPDAGLHARARRRGPLAGRRAHHGRRERRAPVAAPRARGAPDRRAAQGAMDGGLRRDAGLPRAARRGARAHSRGAAARRAARRRGGDDSRDRRRRRARALRAAHNVTELIVGKPAIHGGAIDGRGRSSQGDS